MKKAISAMVILAASIVMSGCLTGGVVAAPDVSNNVLTTTGDVDRVAVCMGLSSVDPKMNNGWTGECPGTFEDAMGLYSLCESNGLTATLLIDSAATWEHWKSVVVQLAAPMKPGSLLLLTMSGHGGQMPDDNGDEADGLDETLCLWDGQVRDDDVMKFIESLPTEIRIVLINDQCHSEGNFRAYIRKMKKAVSMGHWGKQEGRVLSRRSPRWNGKLIQFAGCREETYSYGAETGGTWTQNLLSNFSNGISWREWYDKAAAAMPVSQVPVWVEFGPVDNEFRNKEALK